MGSRRGKNHTTAYVESKDFNLALMWVLIPSRPTKTRTNEGLETKQGLQCISCSNLQVLRCHPCACKCFRISFPLNS